MRAEFKCSESIFITLIHRLYLLDESDPAFLIVSKIKKLPSKLSYNMRSKLRTKPYGLSVLKMMIIDIYFWKSVYNGF